MKTPQRSAAIASALAAEADGLPKDFAAQVAARVEATGVTRASRWNEVALVTAFVAMIAGCLAGWLGLAGEESGSLEWLEPLLSAVRSQPWLGIGVGGLAVVQLLTFGRRISR
jgi:hypothetical protein